MRRRPPTRKESGFFVATGIWHHLSPSLPPSLSLPFTPLLLPSVRSLCGRFIFLRRRGVQAFKCWRRRQLTTRSAVGNKSTRGSRIRLSRRCLDDGTSVSPPPVAHQTTRLGKKQIVVLICPSDIDTKEWGGGTPLSFVDEFGQLPIITPAAMQQGGFRVHGAASKVCKPCRVPQFCIQACGEKSYRLPKHYLGVARQNFPTTWHPFLCSTLYISITVQFDFCMHNCNCW